MRRADWLGATTKRTLTFLLSTNRTVFVTVLPPIGGIDPPISHPAFPMWFGGKPCLFPPLQESLTPTEPGKRNGGRRDESWSSAATGDTFEVMAITWVCLFQVLFLVFAMGIPLLGNL